MTGQACRGIVNPDGGGDLPKADADDSRDGKVPGETHSGRAVREHHPVHNRIRRGGQGSGRELAVNPCCELMMVGLLWAAVIAGLICVVRDCMKDRQPEPTLPDLDLEDCQPWCGPGSLEILPCRREQP